jgi:hypothetical protein
MKKFLFVLLALTICQPAMAQWVEIGGSSTSRIYYDPTRIEPYSVIYQSIWSLADYNAIQRHRGIDKPYRSAVNRNIVDCSRKEMRIISSFAYSENMGKGELAGSENRPASFTSAPPNSVSEVLIDLACKK